MGMGRRFGVRFRSHYNKEDQYHYIHIPIEEATGVPSSMDCLVDPYPGVKNHIRIEQLRIRTAPVNR